MIGFLGRARTPCPSPPPVCATDYRQADKTLTAVKRRRRILIVNDKEKEPRDLCVGFIAALCRLDKYWIDGRQAVCRTPDATQVGNEAAERGSSVTCVSAQLTVSSVRTKWFCCPPVPAAAAPNQLAPANSPVSVSPGSANEQQSRMDRPTGRLVRCGSYAGFKLGSKLSRAQSAQ